MIRFEFEVASDECDLQMSHIVKSLCVLLMCCVAFVLDVLYDLDQLCAFSAHISNSSHDHSYNMNRRTHSTLFVFVP